MYNFTFARTPAPLNQQIKTAGPSAPLLSSQILHVLLYVVAAAAGAVTHAGMSALQWLRVRQRYEKMRDAVFYEFMLLLFQPAPLLLIVMWPGWVLVGALWYYSGGEPAGALAEA